MHDLCSEMGQSQSSNGPDHPQSTSIIEEHIMDTPKRHTQAGQVVKSGPWDEDHRRFSDCDKIRWLLFIRELLAYKGQRERQTVSEIWNLRI
jgi:hypothetical protein